MSDNRSNLLRCALELFAARGYDAIGVQEIVDAAKVTKPTLYHYFGNKRGLLESLVRDGFAPLLQQLHAFPPIDGDVAESLRRVARMYFSFVNQHPLLYRMQLAMWFALPENESFQVISEQTNAQQEVMEKLFTTFSEHNGNLRGRERIYAATFLGTLNSTIGLGINGHVALDDVLAQRVVQTFVYGIYS